MIATEHGEGAQRRRLIWCEAGTTSSISSRLKRITVARNVFHCMMWQHCGEGFWRNLNQNVKRDICLFSNQFHTWVGYFHMGKKNVTVKTKKSHLRDLFHTWRASFSMKCKCPCLLEFPHVETKHGTWSVKVWAWTSTRWYKVNRTFSHVIGFFSHIDENVRPRDLNLLMLITYIDVWSAVFTLRKFNINLSVLSHIYRSDVRKNSLGWETISCLSPSWASGEY